MIIFHKVFFFNLDYNKRISVMIGLNLIQNTFHLLHIPISYPGFFEKNSYSYIADRK
jgi:hypothetical protein